MSHFNYRIRRLAVASLIVGLRSHHYTFLFVKNFSLNILPGARVSQSEIQKYSINKYNYNLLINRPRWTFQGSGRSKSVSVRNTNDIIHKYSYSLLIIHGSGRKKSVSVRGFQP